MRQSYVFRTPFSPASAGSLALRSSAGPPLLEPHRACHRRAAPTPPRLPPPGCSNPTALATAGLLQPHRACHASYRIHADHPGSRRFLGMQRPGDTTGGVFGAAALRIVEGFGVVIEVF